MCPPSVFIQLQMQALELKPTDLWDYLILPQGFLDGWMLVRSAISDYQASLREGGE